MKIAVLVQKLQQFCWMCPGVTCISFLYYLSYKNYPAEAGAGGGEEAGAVEGAGEERMLEQV